MSAASSRRKLLARRFAETMAIGAAGAATLGLAGMPAGWLSGAIVGVALASLLQLVTISTLNFTSFSELAFSFSLSTPIAVSSFAFALAMGLLGGFLPAFRAARLDIVGALRAV